jgi:hypothetical protein
VIEDHEQVARRANVRLWWRRAIVLALIVLIASPITGAIVWWIRFHDAPKIEFEPPVRTHASAMRRPYFYYLRYEGHARRSHYFSSCASQVQMFVSGRSSKPMTEAEVLYYLGPPDRTEEESMRTLHNYYYKYARPQDAQVAVSITDMSGTRLLAGVAFHVAPPSPAKLTTVPATRGGG